ncbi:hypothetical protein BGZ65_011555, partial [Modicella reniformis]
GDQVAIYQEPKIGQWKDGSKVEKCLFRIHVYKNPLVPNQDNIPTIGGENVPNQDGAPVNAGNDGDILVDMRGAPVNPGGNVPNQDSAPTKVGIKLVPQETIPHRIFESFIGYGAFLTEKESIDWEGNNIHTSLYKNLSAEASDDSINSSRTGQPVKPPPTKADTLFVACNGMYIDVFKVISEKEWTHIRAIRLTDLIPALNRRIMCKNMMEAISSNTFMWLEDNGLCCTLWDLQKGSNISYISNADNAKLSSSTFRGSCKMAISPDESIVALASDDTLTTYYASSGIEIDTRKYSGHKVEHIAFQGRSNLLFVVVHRPMSLKLGSQILDPFRLKSQVKINRAPIPIIGKTILAFFRKGPFKNKGLICEADGNKILCYISSEPDAVRVDISEDNIVPTNVRHLTPQLTPADGSELEDGAKKKVKEKEKEEANEGSKDDKQYELKVKHNQENFPEGDGTKYWVLS